jgi:predicted lactoylglutathione lyase
MSNYQTPGEMFGDFTDELVAYATSSNSPPSPHRGTTMTQQIFVNRPVKNLKRSVDFFTALGYRFNPQFTDENATCMIVGDNIFVMLLVEEFFKGFTGKPIADTGQVAEAIISLNAADRAAVDEIVRKARAAGASVPRAPTDHGFMYQHGFQDPDGHMWEYFHMQSMPEQRA